MLRGKLSSILNQPEKCFQNTLSALDNSTLYYNGLRKHKVVLLSWYCTFAKLNLNFANNLKESMSELKPNHNAHVQSIVNGTRTDNGKPIIVGIYGLPGSGKTYLLNQLQQRLPKEEFAFYEGSQMIASLVPGGLDAFQTLGSAEKMYWRSCAIEHIEKECAHGQQTGVVAGHFMFWAEEEVEGQAIYTQEDLDIYTHILYLDVPAEVIARRQLGDTERKRPYATATHMLRWKTEEQNQLRQHCHDNDIIFATISGDPELPDKVTTLLCDFRKHDEQHNLRCATRALDEALDCSKKRLETMLVIDGDRTLAAEDSGALFWNAARHPSQPTTDDVSPFKGLFGSKLGYSYSAFRQAALLTDERANSEEYDLLCQKAAAGITIYPDFLSLLRKVNKEEHIGAVIVSCGLRLIWEKVLEREGLAQTTKVIAGGRISDGFVVTAAVKAALVRRLQNVHHIYVWAFGDSVLDLDMLKVANRAVVVVGEEHARSKSMDVALLEAIDGANLKAVQVVLPSHAPPRLDPAKLPLVQLSGSDFISSILSRPRQIGFEVFDAGNRAAAKLLATPMRNSAVAGPVLREAHQRVGHYLAIEFVANAIGVEECQIPHVLGHHTSGSRLLYEQQTTIIALMRGGEPMASGVNNAFPLAMFLHAHQPEDVEHHYLQGQRQVVLVDSVVNTGKTIVEFVRVIRQHDVNIHIYIVAGVVQAECVSPDSPVNTALTGFQNVRLVTLRLSNTKFTGSRSTDTGNRLFNTTHME